MKRQLLGSVVLFGLAMAGAVISANLSKTQVGGQRGILIADGDPYPPPFPPLCEARLSPQTIADGDPYPPPFPPKGPGRLSEIVCELMA
jgi:hypothetical protein